MISSTSDYALRALIALARERPRPMLARELADLTDVPHSYLSKILSMLRRTGILESSRGLKGGYTLAREPKGIPLINVVEQFEVVRPRQQCLLGKGGCDDTNPCGMHDQWKAVWTSYFDFLESHTVADLASAPLKTAPRRAPRRPSRKR